MGSDESGPGGSESYDLVLAVLKRHEGDLLNHPNVLGVGVGQDDEGGFTLVVLVREKLPPEQLPAGALLPSQLEGIRIDVRGIGEVRPQEGETSTEET